MPIYEYKCKKCGKVFEYFARTLSDSAKECPECSSKNIEKLLSAFTASESTKNECQCEGGRHHHSGGHHCCGGNCCCGR